MLEGRCNHPKKSFPGQVPFSKASCAAFTFGSKASTAPASRKQAAFVMSSLMLLIIFLVFRLNSSRREFRFLSAKLHYFFCPPNKHSNKTHKILLKSKIIRLVLTGQYIIFYKCISIRVINTIKNRLKYDCKIDSFKEILLYLHQQSFASNSIEDALTKSRENNHNDILKYF